MKTIINAYRLFKRQLSSNIIIIMFFAILCSLSAYLYNQYEQSMACYSMFSNSSYNILYVNLPNDVSFDSSQYIELRDSIEAQGKDIEGYVGTSTAFETHVEVNSDKTGGRFCSMYMIDRLTSKALKYKLSQGKWLSESDTVGGIQPCIIGGGSADEYNTGDILNVTFYIGSDVNGEYEIKETQSESYYVAGKFDDKQQFFNICLSSTSSPQPLSYYFERAQDTDLYIWAEHDYTYSQIKSVMDYFITSAPLMYFDKSVPRESIGQVIKKISEVSLFSHYDLMAEEEAKITEDYELVIPVLIILAIVSIVGIYSICLLNVLKNYKTFAIFYLCGCSKRRNILITAAYSSFFMVFTLPAVGIIYIIAVCLTGMDEYVSQYIYINFRHIAGIVLLCFSISFLSFITPCTLLKRISIAKLLNVE